MKAVILALLAVLVVSHSEALMCNCGGMTRCSSSVQTCSGPNRVCANIHFNPPSTGYFRSCYQAGHCMELIRLGIGTGSCCSSDRCN